MHLARKFAAALGDLVTALAVVGLPGTGGVGCESQHGRGSDALCARLIWLRDKDDVNRQYLNQVIVQGTQSSDNKWTGTVKNAGDVYSGTMIMTGQDSLKVNGCQGVFCQTVRLSRV